MPNLILAARAKYGHLLLTGSLEPPRAVAELIKTFRHRKKLLSTKPTLEALLLAVVMQPKRSTPISRLFHP
jgi:hypothetical protein